MTNVQYCPASTCNGKKKKGKKNCLCLFMSKHRQAWFNVCNRGVLIINKNQCLNFELRNKSDKNLGKWSGIRLLAPFYPAGWV